MFCVSRSFFVLVLFSAPKHSTFNVCLDALALLVSQNIANVSSSGGGKALNAEGQMIQAKDQSSGSFYHSFQRAMQRKQPIAIIAGRGNRICPSRLPHYYNVLDWFHVTDLWCELINNVKTGMVRLEKIDLRQASWWMAASEAPPPPLDTHQARTRMVIPTRSQVCEACQVKSKEIFMEGWACLNSECPKYFDFGHSVDHSQLDYNQNFLQERTPFVSHKDAQMPALAPPLMNAQDAVLEGLNGSEEACAKGIVCPKCNGCSRRIDWSFWKCEHAPCEFEHRVPLQKIHVEEAMHQGDVKIDEFYAHSLGVRCREVIEGLYDVYEYSIPGPVNPEDGSSTVLGFVRHYKSCMTINCQEDGPNALFCAMQEDEFNLKRRPVRQPNSVGEILTGHWGTNWGAPYKFVVRQSTRGFSEAPVVMLKALKRLTWAGRQAADGHAESFNDFNELLSLGYMEKSAIGYHDDGEDSLGPTIATLSLGCSATMNLRPKPKSNIGPASKNAKGTKKPVLRMALNHGDIVIMHGAGIQKLYEHEVKPSGKLRFALTCRYVRPETMETDEDRAETLIKGALPNGHEQYDYDGDVGVEPGDSIREPRRDREQLFTRIRNSIHAGELTEEECRALRALLG